MRLFVIIAVVFIASIPGCSSTSIYVPVTRPMEINLTGISLLGIALFPGAQYKSDIREIEAESLTASFAQPFQQDGRFDGMTMDGYSGRMKSTGIQNITPALLAALKEETGADAFVFGEILALEYAEDIIEADVHRYQKPDGKQIVRKGLLRFRVAVRIFNAEERSVLWEKTLERTVKAETSAADSEPAAIDPVPLAEKAASEIAGDILELTVQIQEPVLVTFLNDSDDPAIQRAITKAREGNWASAVEIFSGVAERAQNTSKEHRMLYNLGIAYQFSNNYRDAYASFQRAYALKDDQRYAIAMEDCLRMERSYQELVKQQ